MSPSYRIVNFILLILCISLLSLAYYLQYADHIEPCLLCFMQRVFFFAITAVLLLSCLHKHNKASIFLYNSVLFILSILGLITAARQIWLQHLPAGEPSSCLPSAIFIFKTLPLHKALQLTYAGSAECARTTWSLFGLSLADWSAICFLVILTTVIWQFRHLKDREK